jgi:hypothetical protein
MELAIHFSVDKKGDDRSIMNFQDIPIQEQKTLTISAVA